MKSKPTKIAMGSSTIDIPVFEAKLAEQQMQSLLEDPKKTKEPGTGLSTDTLKSYHKKAVDSLTKGTVRTDKYDKREAGAMKAYRKAYKSKGKSKTQSIEGSKLMKNPAVSQYADAISLALESQKYTTPAHLRALAIHKITEKVLDDACPPAQQLKALELLGKITEVSLFTERREIIKTESSSDMKDKLLESIKMAIANSQAIVVEAHQADDLLAELVGSTSDDSDVSFPELADNDVVHGTDAVEDGDTGSSIPVSSTPLTPDPQFSASGSQPNLHSIPHIQSDQNNTTLTPVRDKIVSESNTYESSNENPNTGTPPVNISNAKG